MTFKDPGGLLRAGWASAPHPPSPPAGERGLGSRPLRAIVLLLQNPRLRFGKTGQHHTSAPVSMLVKPANLHVSSTLHTYVKLPVYTHCTSPLSRLTQ